MPKVKTKEDFIKEATAIHGDGYSYDNEFENMSTPMDIFCNDCQNIFTVTPKRHVSRKQKCPCHRNVVTPESYLKRVKDFHGDKYDFSQTVFKSFKKPITAICREHGPWETSPTSLLKSGCKKCIHDRRRVTLVEFIEKSTKVNGDKYDYSKVEYLNSTTPVKIICPKHGEFEQLPMVHLRGCGCLKCGIDGNYLTTDIFIRRSKDVHGDETFGYDNVVYKGSADKVELLCNKCQESFLTRPANHISNRNGCPKCANDGTPSRGQNEVLEFIQEIYSGKIEENVSIFKDDSKHIDIYIPDKKIGIEFDGVYWHSENERNPSGKGRDYHLSKTLMSEEVGVQLLHIFETEWSQQRDVVKSIIQSKLAPENNARIFGRKCEIRVVTTTDARKFCDINHIQGYCGASIKLGLYHNDDLVSVMTFGKSRFNKTYNWEMVRFCNKLNTTILGGASKLWKHFLKKYNPDSVISYSDRRYFDGSVYPKLGFDFINHANPNYFYFRGGKPEYIKLETRNKYQKHKLSKVLEIFDPNKGEWGNMFQNGYCRIWDCGNTVWGWKSGDE